MKLLHLLSLAAAAVAFPDRLAKTLPYKAPGPGDSRSPCPGLNALANHGYLYVSYGCYLFANSEHKSVQRN